MADVLTFQVSGFGKAPAPDDALDYGRLLAERAGITLPDDAEPRITADGSDTYRVEIPAPHSD